MLTTDNYEESDFRVFSNNLSCCITHFLELDFPTFEIATFSDCATSRLFSDEQKMKT